MIDMPAPFNYADAYWVIETQPDQVYSSSRNIMVSTGDEGFTAWNEMHGGPPSVADESTLWPMLALPAWLFNGETFVQPAEGEYTKDQLAAYSAMKRYEAEIAGTTLNGQPLRTDRVSRSAVDTADAYLNGPGAPSSITWKTLPGFSEWSKTNADEAIKAINDHVQGCFNTEANVHDDIQAGTVTKLDEIDAAYDALRSVDIKGKVEV